MFGLTDPIAQSWRRSELIAERLGQCSDFDRVAQRGAGAVRLHVVDVVGGEAGRGECAGRRASLTVHTRRGERRLLIAVVGNCRADDHGIHVIVVADRVVKVFEHHRASPVADHTALGARVEGPALSVG